MICFLCNKSAVSQKQVKSSTYIYVFFKIKDRGIERWLFFIFSSIFKNSISFCAT